MVRCVVRCLAYPRSPSLSAFALQCLVVLFMRRVERVRYAHSIYTLVRLRTNFVQTASKWTTSKELAFNVVLENLFFEEKKSAKF